MQFFEIRKSLLDEARSSPNLLSDLAGLENYIAESYNNRSFIELLQNADDAGSKRFKILKKDDFLVVANDGRAFNDKDLESLCRSASSNKMRGESIGYRGIGFKSVVGFSNEIHLLSGNFEITFSRKRTATDIPQTIQVPLIRIPHHLSEFDKSKFEPLINQLKKEGYSTLFIFSGVTAHEIELEFESFDSSSLLFLRNICETDLNIGNQNKTRIEKFKIDEKISRITIETNKKEKKWLIINDNETSLAFLEEGGEVKRIDENDSLVYSFLPTEDKTGMGLLINGDFSTDPSRKHIIFDAKTYSSIKICSTQILRLFEENIRRNKNSNLGIVNALIPFTDPRMFQFKKTSFEKILFEELKSSGEKSFQSILISPSWLNVKDFTLLSQDRQNQINSDCYKLEGFTSFIKFLGVKEATLHSFIEKINQVEISTLGCVQISVQLFKGVISKNQEFENWISKLKILKVDEKRISLDQLRIERKTIDNSFISLLIENGLTEFDVKQVLRKYLTEDAIEKMFETNSRKGDFLDTVNKSAQSKQWFNLEESKSFPATRSNFLKWRSAEENTLEILNSKGFRLTDVSKQNIGYDLEGFDPEGREIQIEVKSINQIGEKFKLTNNEVAVAQEKKSTYYIAVVRQLERYIEIALISDPVKNLVLNRQCVQWIWECSNYDYTPIRFET